MNIDDHDYEISFVILESQTEVQSIVAMTVFITHPFMPPAIYGLFRPCSSHYQHYGEQNGYKTGGKHKEICWRRMDIILRGDVEMCDPWDFL